MLYLNKLIGTRIDTSTQREERHNGQVGKEEGEMMALLRIFLSIYRITILIL